MKIIKQKYIGMKKEDLKKAIGTIQKSMASARMTVRDNPKSFGDLCKFRYELALVRSLLSAK
jgi:hypothetical protein